MHYDQRIPICFKIVEPMTNPSPNADSSGQWVSQKRRRYIHVVRTLDNKECHSSFGLFHLNLKVAMNCKFLEIVHGSQRGKYGGLCVGDNISCVHTIWNRVVVTNQTTLSCTFFGTFFLQVLVLKTNKIHKPLNNFERTPYCFLV